MIRFLHAADLHLDSPFSGLSPERAAQRRIVKAVILYLVFAREPVVCDPANNE